MNKFFLSFQDFNEKFSKELAEIEKINKEKNEKYGREENFFSSFQLIQDMGIMPIEKFLVMRGILDKLNRVSNIRAKQSNAVKGEWIRESMQDMVGYALLLHAYLQCKKNNKFAWSDAIGHINTLLSYIQTTFIEKNSDYSSKTTDAELQKQQNAIENFVLVEKYGLSTTEDGVLARVVLKVQRLINLISKCADEKTIGLEILDFIIYCCIYNIILEWKAQGANKPTVVSTHTTTNTPSTNTTLPPKTE